MTPQEFQREAMEAAQATHVMAAQRMAEAVAKPNCDPEIAIKIFNATKDVAQAVPKEKEGAYANLPTVHINIVNGRLTVEARVADAELDVVDVVDMTPSVPMLANVSVNDDLGDLLALEEMDHAFG